MARKGASYPHSFVVDSLCCVSRTSLFTGQYPHQTGVRTNTAAARRRPGRWAARRRSRPTATASAASRPACRRPATPPASSASSSTSTSTSRPRSGAAGPAGLVASSTSSSARPTTGGASTAPRRAGGRLQVRRPPRPAVPTPAPRRRTARTPARSSRSSRSTSSRAHRDDSAPYFLEVAPYAAHSRTGVEGAYPGDPLFPPVFRDRPARDGRRQLRPCRVRPSSPSTTCPASATTAPTTARAGGRQRRRPRWNTGSTGVTAT